MAKVIEDLRNQEPHENGTPKDGHDAEGGAVVAMDVKTGQLLTCASYPSYDLSTYFEDYEQLVETDYNPLLNRALTSSYAPGSTYKVSMLVAAGNAGVVDRYDTINDTRSYKIPGYSKGVACPNHKGFGTVGLDAMEALMGSCNYFFCETSRKSSPPYCHNEHCTSCRCRYHPDKQDIHLQVP